MNIQLDKKKLQLLRLLTIILACASFVFSTPALSKVKKNIRLALVFNLSKKAEAVQQVVEGIELAAYDLNRSGISVELIKFDSKESPGGTLNAVHEAIAIHPDALISELDSSKAFVSAVEAEKSKTVMITPLATSNSITESKKFVFRGTFSDIQQGRALAKFALESGRKTAIVISDVGQLYSQSLANSFKKSFLELGGKIIYSNEIEINEQSFLGVLEEIKNKSPDIVFCPFYSQSAGRFLYLVKQQNIIKPIYLGGDAWGQYTKPFKDLLFKRKNELKVFWAAHYNESKKNKILNEFIKRYENSSHKSFNVSPAISYDVTYVLVKAILKAGGGGVSQIKIANALRSGVPYKGITGLFSFDQSNNNRKEVNIVTSKFGKPEVIATIAP